VTHFRRKYNLRIRYTKPERYLIEQAASPIDAMNPGSNNNRDAQDSTSERALVNRVIAGDQQALAVLFDQHRERLWRMVSFRLHPKLHGRVDPDDVLQDAWLDAVQRIDHFLSDASQSVFIWFRMIVSQTLCQVHRHHLGIKKRDAKREIGMQQHWNSESTSFSISCLLLGHLTSPSQAVLRAELSQQVDTALTGMDELDREVLVLRHFEELTNGETALALGISKQAASLRYVRALARLGNIFATIPEYSDAERKR
jgi:RNA polymerase sigma-70 factor, ECF subfamily